MPIPLILIPCSKKKNVEKGCNELSSSHIRCLEDRPILSELREKMINAVCETPRLANNEHNRDGILNNNAPQTIAHRLYAGALNEAARPFTNQLPIDNFHMLIVSGLYGLVHPFECIRDYELDMDDIVIMGNNNEKVFNFWKNNELWRCLCQYVLDNSITHIWSLLPEDYHRLFFPFMQNYCNVDSFICKRVFVLNVGNAISYDRGKWLTLKFAEDKDFFTHNPHKREEIMIEDRKGRNKKRIFEYRSC